MSELSYVVQEHMEKTTGLERFCDRCLKSERYGGSVVLMIVDAAFDSIGLNYFNCVVPKVLEFENRFVETGTVKDLEDLGCISHELMEDLWENKRSWNVATSVASYLNKLGEKRGLSERESLRFWAQNAGLENWGEDPVGRINGVGITTYQYLRMMGGVDTAMPDKIVRRVIKEILDKSGRNMPTDDDIKFIRTVDRIASDTGYRAIEICWMTWLIQYEGERIRMEKYGDILERI